MGFFKQRIIFLYNFKIDKFTCGQLMVQKWYSKIKHKVIKFYHLSIDYYYVTCLYQYLNRH